MCSVLLLPGTAVGSQYKYIKVGRGVVGLQRREAVDGSVSSLVGNGRLMDARRIWWSVVGEGCPVGEGCQGAKSI